MIKQPDEVVYSIQAKDGSFKKWPGDSLSSRYDDTGYTTWDIVLADHHMRWEDAKYGMNKDGKFSEEGGAKVVGVKMSVTELVFLKKPCDNCDESSGTVYTWCPSKCSVCDGTGEITEITTQDHLDLEEAKQLTPLLTEPEPLKKLEDWIIGMGGVKVTPSPHPRSGEPPFEL